MYGLLANVFFSYKKGTLIPFKRQEIPIMQIKAVVTFYRDVNVSSRFEYNESVFFYLNISSLPE